MSIQLATAASHVSTAIPAIFGNIGWDADKTESHPDLDNDLNAVGTVLNFSQDREIYGEGDKAEIFYKVVSGVVRTCKFLSDGRRQIDAFYIAGEVFGFEPGKEYRLSAEAVSDCTLIAYRRQGVEKLAAGNDVLSQQLFSYALHSMARAQEHSLVLGRRSAVEKVAAFLMEWAQRSASSQTVALAMTRQDIADYLGLTIETVSRTLSQLERDAVIELPSARQIRFKDRAALRDLNS